MKKEAIMMITSLNASLENQKLNVSMECEVTPQAYHTLSQAFGLGLKLKFAKGSSPDNNCLFIWDLAKQK